MDIVYATDINASNIHNWSGLGWYYRKMLEETGCAITTLDKSNMPPPAFYRLKNRILKKVGGKLYSPRFSIPVSKHNAHCIQKQAAKGSVILSPNTSILAYLDGNFKKVLYADATFDSLLHLYPKYSQYTNQCLIDGERIDQQAVANADLLIYTSQWAANSAIQHYGANPAKVFIVPFGANLDRLPSAEVVQQGIQARLQTDHINLLFLGVDWVRKGGDKALQVATQLNALGIKATLHVVGAVNMPADIHEPFVKKHGFISKATPEGQRQLGELLIKSHFLLLPTLADCTPVACSEANAFGVPCITTDVGGLSSIITNDSNGYTFPVANFVDAATTCIANLAMVKSNYEALCFAAHHKYETEMNWKSVGKRIVRLVQEI